MKKKGRVSINDVAEKAGVSKATVSAVINGMGTVRDSTRDHVSAIIQELNYRPSPIHRRSSYGRDKSLGLLIKEANNPYYADVISSARVQAEARGYRLLIASSEGEYETEKRLVELFRAKEVDGLIINPVLDVNTDLSHLFELNRHNFPFVLLEEIRGLQASSVDIDNVELTRKIVKYLIKEGHSRIVHFAGPRYSIHTEQRASGVRRAYSESSLIFTDELIVPAGAHPRDGYRCGLEHFRDRPASERPTAVVCYNDMVALGLIRALGELGIPVPLDVSVIGIDDTEFLEYMPISLSSARLPKDQVAELATQLLIQQIEDKARHPIQKIVLESELVIRQSSRSLLTDGRSASGNGTLTNIESIPASGGGWRS